MKIECKVSSIFKNDRRKKAYGHEKTETSVAFASRKCQKIQENRERWGNEDTIGIGLNGRNIIEKELGEQCANEGRKRMFPKHDRLSLLIEKNCS